MTFQRLAPLARPVLVNGATGFAVSRRGGPFAVAGFTVHGGKVVEIDVLADAERLSRLNLAVLDE